MVFFNGALRIPGETIFINKNNKQRVVYSLILEEFTDLIYQKSA